MSDTTPKITYSKSQSYHKNEPTTTSAINCLSKGYSSHQPTLFKQIDTKDLQHKLDFIEFKRLKQSIPAINLNSENLQQAIDSDTISIDSQLANNNQIFTENDRIINERVIEQLNDFISVPNKKEYFNLYNINEFGDLIRLACKEQLKLVRLLNKLSEFLNIAKDSVDIVRRNGTANLQLKDGKFLGSNLDHEKVYFELNSMLKKVYKPINKNSEISASVKSQASMLLAKFINEKNENVQEQYSGQIDGNDTKVNKTSKSRDYQGNRATRLSPTVTTLGDGLGKRGNIGSIGCFSVGNKLKKSSRMSHNEFSIGGELTDIKEERGHKRDSQHNKQRKLENHCLDEETSLASSEFTETTDQEATDTEKKTNIEKMEFLGNKFDKKIEERKIQADKDTKTIENTKTFVKERLEEIIKPSWSKLVDQENKEQDTFGSRRVIQLNKAFNKKNNDKIPETKSTMRPKTIDPRKRYSVLIDENIDKKAILKNLVQQKKSNDKFKINQAPKTPIITMNQYKDNQNCGDTIKAYDQAERFKYCRSAENFSAYLEDFQHKKPVILVQGSVQENNQVRQEQFNKKSLEAEKFSMGVTAKKSCENIVEHLKSPTDLQNDSLMKKPKPQQQRIDFKTSQSQLEVPGDSMKNESKPHPSNFSTKLVVNKPEAECQYQNDNNSKISNEAKIVKSQTPVILARTISPMLAVQKRNFNIKPNNFEETLQEGQLSKLKNFSIDNKNKMSQTMDARKFNNSLLRHDSSFTESSTNFNKKDLEFDGSKNMTTTEKTNNADNVKNEYHVKAWSKSPQAPSRKLNLQYRANQDKGYIETLGPRSTHLEGENLKGKKQYDAKNVINLGPMILGQAAGKKSAPKNQFLKVVAKNLKHQEWGYGNKDSSDTKDPGQESKDLVGIDTPYIEKAAENGFSKCFKNANSGQKH